MLNVWGDVGWHKTFLGVPLLCPLSRNGLSRLVCRIFERKYFFLPGFFLDRWLGSIPEDLIVIWTLIWSQCPRCVSRWNDENSSTAQQILFLDDRSANKWSQQFQQKVSLASRSAWLNLSHSGPFHQSVCSAGYNPRDAQSAGLSALKTCLHRSGGMSSMICATDSLVANNSERCPLELWCLGNIIKNSDT